MFPSPEAETRVIGKYITDSEKLTGYFIKPFMDLLILLSIAEVVIYYIQVGLMSRDKCSSTPFINCPYSKVLEEAAANHHLVYRELPMRVTAKGEPCIHCKHTSCKRSDEDP